MLIDAEKIRSASRVSAVATGASGPDAVLFWNDVLLEIHRRDFTFADKVGEDESDSPIDRQGLSPEQGGPTRTSRAFAMAHLAMFEVCRAYDNTIGASCLTPAPTAPNADIATKKAAIGTAAAATIGALWKQDGPFLAAKLSEWRGLLANQGATPVQLAAGFVFGDAVARRIVAKRKDDKSELPNDYVPLGVPRTHRQDPFVRLSSRSLGRTGER